MARRRRRNRGQQQQIGTGADPSGVGLLDSLPAPMQKPEYEQLRPDGAGEDDPDELLSLAKQEMDRWQPLHQRQDEDMAALRGRWFEQPESPNELLASKDTIADTSLRTQAHKAINIISTADATVRINPSQPQQAPLVEQAEHGWRYFEDQVEQLHAREGTGGFSYERASYAINRGWVALRLRLLPEAVLAGDFPFEVQLVDMRALTPIYGVRQDGRSGITHVVQRNRWRRLQILQQWPELADLAIPELNDPKRPIDDLEALDVIALYTEWDVHYYVQEKHVLTIPHDYGEVPFVLVPCRSVVLQGMTGIDQPTAYIIGNVVMTNGVLGDPDTADIGVSFIHDIIGPTRNLVKHMNLLSERGELDVRPILKKKAATASEAAGIDTAGALGQPGSDIPLAQDQDVEVLDMPKQLDYINLMIERWVANIEQGGLPKALWGLDSGATSALHQTYVTAAATDALNPYIAGICLAREQLWRLAMRLYARFAPDWASFSFMVRQGQQAFWQQLTPDDFATLQDARLRASYRNVLPNEKTQAIVNAMQLMRAGLGDRLTLLGDAFIGVDDPHLVIERMDAEAAEQFPVIKMAKAIKALQHQDPELYQQFGPLLEQQLQQAVQQASQPQPPQPQPGMGGPPGGPGPAVPPLPPQPAATGPGGGLQGPPPGPPPDQAMGPLPYNDPGMTAALAGLPSVPGGLDMGGVPTSMPGGSPYGMGQGVAGPGAEPPALALMRMLMAQGNSGVMPAR